jgi:hypothetical protein
MQKPFEPSEEEDSIDSLVSVVRISIPGGRIQSTLSFQQLEF